MMEAKGIRVLEFEFKEEEVNEMNTDGHFKQKDGSFESPLDSDDEYKWKQIDRLMELKQVMVRDETAFKRRLEGFLLKHGIA